LGALPPAFPAVNIDGEMYWDGGIYSNTPIEVVLDDKPRRNSLIFFRQRWHPTVRAENDLAGPASEGHPVCKPREKPVQRQSRSQMRHISGIGQAYVVAQREVRK